MTTNLQVPFLARHSLAQITYSWFALILLFCAVTGLLLSSSILTDTENQVKRGLRVQADFLAEVVSQAEGSQRTQLVEILKAVDDGGSGNVFIIDTVTSRYLLNRNHPELTNQFVPQDAIVDEARAAIRTAETQALIYQQKRQQRLLVVAPVAGGEWALGVETSMAEVKKLFWLILLKMAGIGGGCCILMVLMVRHANSMVSYRLDRLTSGLQQLTSRNLSRVIEPQGKTRFSQVEQQLQATQQMLQQLVQAQQQSAETLAAAAGQLDSSIAKSLDDNGGELKRLGMLAASMEQMSSSVAEVAAMSANSATGQEQIKQQTQQGLEQQQHSVNTICSLAEQLQHGALSMTEVDSSVDEIGSIVDTINAISEQTNLLALNAAIEAARAGDKGRGFAVVADEVRQLAFRTQQATGEIAEKITRLQSSSKEAIQLLDECVNSTDNTQQLAQSATQLFDEIASNVVSQNDNSRSIACATEQQAEVSQHVSENLQSIQVLVNESEQELLALSQASGELKQHSVRLLSETEVFKLA